jgi:hypothetical protein
VNVTAFRYDGVIHIGINADPAATSDPDRLSECLRRGFEEILRVEV